MSFEDITFTDYIESLGIVYFTAAELLSRNTPGGPKIIEPPRELWPNIVGTLVMADRIREELGHPLHVWSAYRTPEYNAMVGGAKRSEHMGFRALDLHAGAEHHHRLKLIASNVMEGAASAGHRTGLGIYSRFIHIDTGSPKAKRRRWLGT